MVIGRPATGALVDAGYASLDDLPADLAVLRELHGVGPRAVARLSAARAGGPLTAEVVGPATQEGVTRSAAVDAYVAGFPPEVADRLAAVRATLAAHLGGGEEVVRYGMPAVMLDPHHGLHFAGWKKHVALYPVPVFDEPLESAVALYRSSKDGVAFRHSQELPVDLVGRICDALVRRWGDELVPNS